MAKALKRSQNRISNKGATQVQNNHILRSNTRRLETAATHVVTPRTPPPSDCNRQDGDQSGTPVGSPIGLHLSKVALPPSPLETNVLYIPTYRKPVITTPRAPRAGVKRRVQDRDEALLPSAGSAQKRLRTEPTAQPISPHTTSMPPPDLPLVPSPLSFPAFGGPLAGLDAAGIEELARRFEAGTAYPAADLALFSAAVERLQNAVQEVARQEQMAREITGGITRAVHRVEELYEGHTALEGEGHEPVPERVSRRGRHGTPYPQRVARAPPVSPTMLRSPSSSPTAPRRADTPRPTPDGSIVFNLPSLPISGPNTSRATTDAEAELEAEMHMRHRELVAETPAMTDEQAREYTRLLLNGPTDDEISVWMHERGIYYNHSAPIAELGPMPGPSRARGTPTSAPEPDAVGPVGASGSPVSPYPSQKNKRKGKAHAVPEEDAPPTHSDATDSDLDFEELELLDQLYTTEQLQGHFATALDDAVGADAYHEREVGAAFDLDSLREDEAIEILDTEEDKHLQQAWRRLEFFQRMLARLERDSQRNPSTLSDVAACMGRLVGRVVRKLAGRKSILTSEDIGGGDLES